MSVLTDPRIKYPAPPFAKQKQKPPATDTEMSPKPDYGEQSYIGANKLKGKVALITGGDSGIGKAVALAYAREGADICFAYLNEAAEKKDAEESAKFITDAGRRAVVVTGDIRDEEFCKSLIKKTINDLGPIDILVNNAAYQMTYSDISEVTAEELEKVFHTNVFGTFFMTKAALEVMQPGAAIINTVSIQGFHPSAILLPYAASKGALVAYTKALSQETIKRGIRTNGVAPGPIWTPLIPSTMPNAEEFGKQNPMGRPGQPAELAPVYVLLASDDASYINGEIYGVTGGAMAE